MHLSKTISLGFDSTEPAYGDFIQQVLLPRLHKAEK